MTKITGSKATLKGSSNGSIHDILWGLTLKYNPNTNNDPGYLLEKYKNYFEIFPYDLLFRKWEKRDKLHLHACFMAPNNLTFTSLSMLNYHVYLKPVYDLKGWYSYCNKERNSRYIARRDQKDYEELAQKQYLFV